MPAARNERNVMTCRGYAEAPKYPPTAPAAVTAMRMKKIRPLFWRTDHSVVGEKSSEAFQKIPSAGIQNLQLLRFEAPRWDAASSLRIVGCAAGWWVGLCRRGSALRSVSSPLESVCPLC